MDQSRLATHIHTTTTTTTTTTTSSYAHSIEVKHLLFVAAVVVHQRVRRVVISDNQARLSGGLWAPDRQVDLACQIF